MGPAPAQLKARVPTEESDQPTTVPALLTPKATLLPALDKVPRPAGAAAVHSVPSRRLPKDISPTACPASLMPKAREAVAPLAPPSKVMPPPADQLVACVPPLALATQPATCWPSSLMP